MRKHLAQPGAGIAGYRTTRLWRNHRAKPQARQAAR
jgi:hypothetical protein